MSPGGFSTLRWLRALSTIKWALFLYPILVMTFLCTVCKKLRNFPNWQNLDAVHKDTFWPHWVEVTRVALPSHCNQLNPYCLRLHRIRPHMFSLHQLLLHSKSALRNFRVLSIFRGVFLTINGQCLYWNCWFLWQISWNRKLVPFNIWSGLFSRYSAIDVFI